MGTATIVGRVSTGVGQGRHFTQLDWARAQFIERLDIDPYPGTLNLILEGPDALEAWNRLRAEAGVRIDNPNDGPHECDARCYPVLIAGQIEAAIVLPEVDGYGSASIEMIAPVNVRGALGLVDGDMVTVTVRPAPRRPA